MAMTSSFFIGAMTLLVFVHLPAHHPIMSQLETVLQVWRMWIPTTKDKEKDPERDIVMGWPSGDSLVSLGGKCKVVSLAHSGGQSRTERPCRWIGMPRETFCEVLRGFNVLVFPPTSVGVAALRKPCVGVLVKYWFVIGSSIKVERNGRLLGGALTSRED